MKNLFFLIVFFLTTAFSFAQSQVWVDGYYRSNGTYVQGHYRTEKNHTVNDNWTPNYNPLHNQPKITPPTPEFS